MGWDSTSTMSRPPPSFPEVASAWRPKSDRQMAHKDGSLTSEKTAFISRNSGAAPPTITSHNLNDFSVYFSPPLKGSNIFSVQDEPLCIFSYSLTCKSSMPIVFYTSRIIRFDGKNMCEVFGSCNSIFT